MLVYVNKFWDGFISKINPVHIGFFLDIFTKVFNVPISVSSDIEKSDILLESIFLNDIPLVSYKKWKYSFLFSGESHYSYNGDTSNLELYSCILGFTPSHNNYIKCPLFIPYLYCNSRMYAPVTDVPSKEVCSIIAYTHDNVRTKFIDALEKKIHISHGGNFRNNIGGNIQGSYNSENVLNFYNSHKFSICMENKREEYYITEKIMNGLKAGTVPIYWGSPNVTKYFNQDRFLELKSDSDADIDVMVNKIACITDEDYMKMVNAPIFINDIDRLIEDLINDIKRCLNLS